MTVSVTSDNVHLAIKVILSDTAKFNTTLNCAVKFCQKGLTEKGDGLRLQCYHILYNIRGWQHLQAENVRRILRAYKGD